MDVGFKKNHWNIGRKLIERGKWSGSDDNSEQPKGNQLNYISIIICDANGKMYWSAVPC